MRSHVIVHNGSTQTDITPYIVAGSYDINIDSKYASWNDGNMVEHRIVTAEKVTGSFDIACSDKRNSILLSEFLNIWNSAVTNHVINLGVYVPSLNIQKTIDAYFKISNADHVLLADGNFIDVFTIEIKER